MMWSVYIQKSSSAILVNMEKNTKSKKAKPAMPEVPCGCCGSTAWWYREPRMILGNISPGGWICGRCHPEPSRETGKEELWQPKPSEYQ